MGDQQPPSAGALTDETMQVLFEHARTLAQHDALPRALDTLHDDPRLRERATADPAAFVQSLGVDLPAGLDVVLTTDPLRGKPMPDHEFFTIRLFNCRTFWVRKRDGSGFEQVEVCLGFEIVPNPLPGGPIA